MKAKSKGEIIVRNRKIALLCFIVLCITLSMFVFSNRASAEDSREIYSYYTSYEIQPGDTLWSIADQFIGPDFTDKETFISNIKEINHLSSDKITAGNYLVIQYYSYEKL